MTLTQTAGRSRSRPARLVHCSKALARCRMARRQTTNAKVAIVTGGGSGIGVATAEILARDGASVLVCDLDADPAASTAHRIVSTGGAAMPFQIDVTDAQAHSRAVAKAERIYGGLDIAVNCAGISVGPSKSQQTVQDTDLSDCNAS